MTRPRDCLHAAWVGRVNGQLLLVEQTPDGITAATKDAYDPWATWGVPCHLRAVKAEEVGHA